MTPEEFEIYRQGFKDGFEIKAGEQIIGPFISFSDPEVTQIPMESIKRAEEIITDIDEVFINWTLEGKDEG